VLLALAVPTHAGKLHETEWDRLLACVVGWSVVAYEKGDKIPEAAEGGRIETLPEHQTDY
jgi:hypothetical protein